MITESIRQLIEFMKSFRMPRAFLNVTVHADRVKTKERIDLHVDDRTTPKSQFGNGRIQMASTFRARLTSLTLSKALRSKAQQSVTI